MKLYTFTGETPSIALKKAQNACGKDALVVNTKMIRKKTLTQDGLYEVVVAVEDEKEVADKETIFDKKKKEALEKTARNISLIDSLSIDKNASDKNSPDIEELQKSLENVNKRMLELQKLLLESETKGNFIIPPEFMSIYQKLKSAGIEQKDIEEIIGESIKFMPTYMKSSDKMIYRYFKVLLKKIIPIRKESPIKRQKIMMMVGPTGVGKTTTLAKLAARYSILEYNYKIGIITLDTYRIGAVEQLYQYAKMMKLPIEDVIGVDDFKRAIDRYVNMDIILIDTVGSSQYDKEKLKKLKKYISISDIKVDANLVVSANSKLEDLKEIYNSFSFLDIDTMSITKFDETKTFGNLFSLIKDIKLPLTYFSIGQEVPDDLMLASSDFLVDCLLEGFKNV
jgi:flagellar biosynthesis protein FlhF